MARERYKSMSELQWARYPVRKCRVFSAYLCERCGKHIEKGQRYVDGGNRRRGHVACLILAGDLTEQEPT